MSRPLTPPETPSAPKSDAPISDAPVSDAPVSDTPTELTFSDLPLSAEVLAAVDKIGYERPSPIQEASIPVLAEGHDLLATAQTGTGKTAAFALPILSKIDPKKKTPQALVLAPTRELAIQVGEALKSYASEMPRIEVLAVYGGQGMNTQLTQLKRGTHIVVGTPGRVMDHLRRKTLKLHDLKTLVLDEADEMLRMGFIDDVEWILEHTPAERQTALFSATMPKPIQKIADTYLTNPKRINIKSKTKTVEAIDQQYWAVSGASKFDGLCRILEIEDTDGVIIFTRTKSSTILIAEKLQANGYAAAPINGDMTQQLRERTITQLKGGGVDILIATDVAARGIDVKRISHVINYDMPYDNETYVHRIGRTGRAGRSGKAILFVAPREKRLLHSIERSTGQKIESIMLPSKKEVAAKRGERFKDRVKKQLTQEIPQLYQQVVRELIEETGAEPTTIAMALAALDPKDHLTIPQPEKFRESSDDSRSKRGERKPRRGDDDRKGRTKERDRAPRESKKVVDDNGNAVAMNRYRMSVGHNHNVSPSDIVGCIANEADISSQYIGRIQLFDDHSFVELPDGMPKEIEQHLQKVKVRQQALKLTLASSDEPNQNEGGTSSKEERKPRKRPASTSFGDKAPSKKGKRSDSGSDSKTDSKPKNKTSDKSKPAKKKSVKPKPKGKKPAGKKPAAKKAAK